MKVISFADQKASFAARFHPSAAGQVSSLSASADDSKVESIDAAAAVRGFNPGINKLVWVKARAVFYVTGEPDPVLEGQLAQLIDGEANRLFNRGMAAPATDEEVAAAQKKGSK